MFDICILCIYIKIYAYYFIMIYTFSEMMQRVFRSLITLCLYVIYDIIKSVRRTRVQNTRVTLPPLYTRRQKLIIFETAGHTST